tara:strand:+ start:4166 stop:5623 length:1458 start_codon:yes stop_codon:yes gene_type:complete
MSIPKIIHQIWIGPSKSPTKFMDTWKNIHEKEGFEYIRWTEEELYKRKFTPTLIDKINEMEEINGKADILRWELLYEYGGFFVDADAYCLQSVKELVEKYNSFVCYENEIIRGKNWAPPGMYDDVLPEYPLLATGTMAFPPKHELPRLAIEWIKNNDISVVKTNKRAWRTVGPGLLTKIYWTNKWKKFHILPSYLFLPIHASGQTYIGHRKIYANQEWGSTKKSYEIMNTLEVPDILNTPEKSISILLPCYNINANFFKKTLDSILDQQFNIFINLICINDGSNDLCTKLLKKLLEQFEKKSRWIKVHYYENEKNIGIGPTLHKGVHYCPDEIIFRMDSDDIMTPNRLKLQYEFIENNDDCVLCGGQISFFKGNSLHPLIPPTKHKTITLDDYKNNTRHWIMNHPTFCFKKSKIIEVGNYNKDIREMCEDFELELRVLKKYGVIHNIPEVIVYYRDSPGQITKKLKNSKSFWYNIRNKLIRDIIF